MALIWYVDNVGGGSGYSGSSEGSPKASGNNASTTSADPVVVLSVDTPNLSTVVVGDTIRLNGRTDGIRNTDIFEITAVDDTLDTVNVTPTPGSTTAGIVWSIGGAFNTIDRYARVCRAGDKTWIKNSADYVETIIMDVAGSTSANISFEGYSSVSGDGGSAVVDGQTSRGYGIVDNIVGPDAYHVFKNMNFISHISGGVNISSNYITWKNCEFNDNLGHGFHLTSSINGLNSFEECKFNNNLQCGLRGAGDDRLIFIGCDFMRNGLHGILGQNLMFSFCTFFDNSDRQILYTAGDVIFIDHCTIDGKDKDNTGIDFGFNLNINAILINTIVVGCASGFIVSNGIGERMLSRSNCFYDNILNYASGAFTLENEVLSDPLFFGRQIQDYRLTSNSPCIGVGYDGASLSGYSVGCDIGAYQSI